MVDMMTTNVGIPMHLWNYRATYTRVVDGDTLVMFCDDGKHHYSIEMYRLADIDTWESRRPTRSLGVAATRDASDWLFAKAEAWRLASDERTQITFDYACVWPFYIHTEKDDAFGRFLVTVQSRLDGETLTDFLRLRGHEKAAIVHDRTADTFDKL